MGLKIISFWTPSLVYCEVKRRLFCERKAERRKNYSTNALFESNKENGQLKLKSLRIKEYRFSTNFHFCVLSAKKNLEVCSSQKLPICHVLYPSYDLKLLFCFSWTLANFCQSFKLPFFISLLFCIVSLSLQVSFATESSLHRKTSGNC